MTLFDSLFTMPSVRDRYNRAPLREERERFLLYLQAHGRKCTGLKQAASHLLQINRTLRFVDCIRPTTHEELNAVGRQWAIYAGPSRRRQPGKCSYGLYIRFARAWLRYNSCLIEPRKSRWSEERLQDYERRLRDEIGLGASTIETRSRHASFFLMWLQEYRVKLHNVTLSHVERYFDAKRASGWALTTLILGSTSIRMFLRHAELRGWVRPGLYEAVPRFLKAKHHFVQKGPTWQNVVKMISSLSRSDRAEVRDRAMLLLMSQYGLRFGEIRDLRMTDVDFENKILNVRRGKTNHFQRFPLNKELSNSLRKYITKSRPKSDHPAVFITSVTPYRQISHGTAYWRTRMLFLRNKVESVNKGPHSLRHACAARLMQKGASVNEIAAFLGQRYTRSVRDYVRYDLKGLRQVANFSLEGLM
jgi:integrase/recombinase XerD